VLAQLPDVLPIYRGIGSVKGRNGLSWTLDRERAIFLPSASLAAWADHPCWPPTLVSQMCTRCCLDATMLGILQDLQEKGVDLFLHQQGLDTSTTAGKAMFP
jgi:hypothetical protein